jgi:WD40 repeat protein
MLVLEGHTSPVYTLAFSPDGGHLASGAKGGSVRLWDASGGSPEGLSDDVMSGPINAVEFRPEGEELVIGGATGWVKWQLFQGNKYSLLSAALTGGVTAVRFLSPTLLAVGYGSRIKPEPGSLDLWDLGTGRRREPRFQSPHGVRAVAVHPESRRVAWSEWGGGQSGPRLTVWDITSPDQTRLNLAYNCVSLSFHPDGDRLAAAVDRGVKVFDLVRKQERLTLKGHKGTVSAVAYSPDGRTLATGSWDGTVRLWDPEAGAERACFQWPTGRVFALAYSPDGLRLAAAGEKGVIVLWDAD